MATDPCEYRYVYLNCDGTFVEPFRAEWEAEAFRDYGYYLIPVAFFGEFLE